MSITENDPAPWERRLLRAQEYGGAVDGQRYSVGSDEQGSAAEANQSALRARVRQLMKEKFEYDEIWLADGNSMFEDCFNRVQSGRSVLCDEL